MEVLKMNEMDNIILSLKGLQSTIDIDTLQTIQDDIDCIRDKFEDVEFKDDYIKHKIYAKFDVNILNMSFLDIKTLINETTIVLEFIKTI